MQAVQYYGHISELPKACLRLFSEGEQDSFGLSADWFRLLTETALPPGVKSRLYVLADGREIRCILPLSFKTHHVTGLTTFYTTLYRPLLAADAHPDELAMVLRRVIRDTHASSLRLDAMDPSHPSYNLTLAALQLAGLKASSFFDFGNWHQPVSSHPFETYFNSLSSQVRNTVKRRGKKFLSSGGRLEIVTGDEGLELAIQAWDRIYRSSWKVPEPYPEFVPGLIRLCARKAWLRLGLAYYNNVPIAAQIWIVNHGRAAIYKLAYDESYAQHSAGTLLTAHLMRQVMDVDKVGEVDYLVGDDAYKKDWMGQRRERWGIVAYNLLSVYGIGGYGIHISGRLWHRINKRPPGFDRSKITTGKQDMQWKLYPPGDVERFASNWDSLNKNGADSSLLTSQYLLAALHAFGTGRERLACMGDPQAPDCMGVLVERRRGVWETFQPAQAPLGFWVMRNGLDLPTVLHTLVPALPGFSLMVGITQQDPLLLPRPASSAHLQTLNYIDTARIVIEGKFEPFWESRGKNLRQNMRKARNKLEKAGLAVKLVCITDPAAVKEAIAHYGQLESAGWKAKDGTAVHLENEQGRFYKELLETHCQNGTGRIYQLMFNDRIAAMDLCVQRGGVIVILKTTYDESAAEYSPAMLMHQELFQALFESGEFQRIEFYGKVMDWHLRWTEDKRTMYHINFYRWAWLKKLFARADKAPGMPERQAD